MANEPLERACRNVGGQTKLAQMIGVGQANVWSWINVSGKTPAEFVLKIEEVSLISRHDLRPDVYPREMSRGSSSVVSLCTEDGTWIVRDPETGMTASGRTLPEAIAELRRLLGARVAA